METEKTKTELFKRSFVSGFASKAGAFMALSACYFASRSLKKYGLLVMDYVFSDEESTESQNHQESTNENEDHQESKTNTSIEKNASETQNSTSKKKTAPSKKPTKGTKKKNRKKKSS